MTPKATSHVIQGMQKDTSKSKLSKEFAFDAKNIRITAREDNSLLTVTNEKGNKFTKSLFGSYLGHCVLNNQLIIFTTTVLNKDFIFLYDSDFNQTILYSGILNFSLYNPIEALGVYENEEIQKVYWVDGINQPRVINIKASEEVRSKWSDTSFDFIPELALQESVSVEAISNSSMFAPGVIQYAFSYYNKYGQESNIFDVTPLCYIAHKERGASPEEVIKDIAFKIRVDNIDTNFDYIRIYSIHRTSLDATPTVKRVIDLPISIPEEFSTVLERHSTYSIGPINKAYLRRLSVLPPGAIDYNGKLLTDVFNSHSDISSETSKFGTITTYKLNKGLQYNWDIVIGEYNGEEFTIEKEISGDISDFNYVETLINREDRAFYDYSFNSIYINTSAIDPKFITVKYTVKNGAPFITYIDNGTLGEAIDTTQLLYIGGEDIIAGTITQKDNTLFLGNIELKQLSIDDEIKNLVKDSSIAYRIKDLKNNEERIDNYHYSNVFINNYSYFKSGEHYRLGVQVQYRNGRWAEPIFIGDYTVPLGVNPVITDSKVQLPSPYLTVKSSLIDKLLEKGFKKIRGLVVFPEEYERKVLAQGMLCPTLFNDEDRQKDNPYCISSWFMRPNLHINIDNSLNLNEPYEDGTGYEKIYEGAVVEFRHNKPIFSGKDRGGEIQNGDPYYVDQSILTMHSPDIEFGNLDIFENNVKLRLVGFINFTSNYGDINIQTSSPTKHENALGFIKNKISKLDNGSRSLVSGLFYHDSTHYDDISDAYFLVYPWQSMGSITGDTESNTSVLKCKKISNIKISNHNTWFNYNDIWYAEGGTGSNSQANGISKILKFKNDDNQLLKIHSIVDDLKVNYLGNIDSMESSNNGGSIFFGNTFIDTLKEYKTTKNPVRIKYKSGPHCVFRFNKTTIGKSTVILPTLSNLNPYKKEQNSAGNLDLGTEIKFYEPQYPDAEIGDYWLDLYSKITNYPGWHKLSRKTKEDPNYGHNEWTEVIDKTGKDKFYYMTSPTTAQVYKCENFFSDVYGWKLQYTVTISPEDNTYDVVQDSLNYKPEYPYLYLAELYIDSDFIKNAFGGVTDEAIKNNLWLPASRSYNLENIEDGFIYEYGDTRYQRYDCLKTYAFTPEDENQVVEIASFMCETRVNMLGRYDKNIGNLSNLNADPTNFNLFNPVYSQKDNFFNYRILDSDIYKLDKFNNTITWSKEKHLGEDVDTWTNITMASTLDLDGTKGKVNKLLTFKDQIFAFQDKGISNILFNSRVQIPVSDGVPVEISNGMKVDGSRYISDNIGCQNKNSIITTPSGVYFLDSESNGIYLLADGLTNLSTNKGFDIWTKEVSKDSSFKSFYDKNEKDVYFTTKDYCLGYSEKLGQFTSFYDYNDVETMFNIGTGFYSIKADSVGNQSIYQHSIGNYNEFYGEIKPYHLTIISNEDPQVNKVFTNLDYRADFFDSNNNYLENESFDTLEVWNEYQRGKETLKYSKFRPSNLKKKFRMWGVNIPRDKKNKLDRMRNPWLYIKLSKEKPGTSKMELHDLVVKYLE